MAHPFDLPGNLPASLVKPNLKINVRVIWQGKAKVVTGYTTGGDPIYSATYQDCTVDISQRVSTSSISISLEKQIMPQSGDQLITASEISIELINTDERFSTAQDGSIIDPASIEGGQFTIFATITGASPALDIYRGRCIGIPDEEFGITRFKVRDIFWEALKKPLVYEFFSAVTVQAQNTYVWNNLLFNVAPEIIQGDGYLKPYDGYCAFTEDGEVITTVEVSDRTKVDLWDIQVKNGCPLGNFFIEFIGNENFRFSQPDGSVFYGDILNDFETDFIKIKGNYWNPVIQPNGTVTDLTGVKVQFQTRYTVFGNPVTIIKNLIEKSFLQNWGDLPSDTTQVGFTAANLPVRWNTFNDLENQWKNYRVYFSESNKDNKVFEKRSGQKPINPMTLAQTIADHIGASILVDNTGMIYIQSAKIGETVLHTLSGADAIIKGSFKINSNKKPNFITLYYGRNDRTDNYGAKKEYDLRADPDYEFEEYNLNLPYFKAGVSKWQAQEVAEIFMERNLTSIVEVSFELTPQYGLAIMPGDRVRIISTEQPKIDGYFEIIRVSKRISSTEPVQVDAVKIQEPEGKLPTICDWVLCQDVLC